MWKMSKSGKVFQFPASENVQWNFNARLLGIDVVGGKERVEWNIFPVSTLSTFTGGGVVVVKNQENVPPAPPGVTQEIYTIRWARLRVSSLICGYRRRIPAGIPARDFG
jgi:hypothetical protein